MATGNFDLTAADKVIKSQFSEKQAFKVLAAKSPLLNLIKKNEGVMVGRDFQFAIQYGTGRGVATTLAKATSSKSTSLYANATLKRSRLYGKGGIDRETMMAAANNKGAFVEGIMREQDGVLESMKERFTQFLYANGGGAAGRIGAIAGSTITLSEINNARFFQENGIYEISATDGNTGALRAGGTLTCTAVDRATGLVTFSAGVVATIATAVVGDYIFAQGDHATVYADASGLRVLLGLEAWIPRVAPGATLFNGIDRSKDPVRLGGCRYSAGAGGPIEETLQDAMANFANQGADAIDTILMNPIKLQKLAISLGNRVTYNTITSSTTKVGFKGIVLATAAGDITILRDPACPQDVAYALQLDTWELATMSEFPSIKSPDGLTLRQATDGSDNWEWIYTAFGQLGCHQPGKNGVILL